MDLPGWPGPVLRLNSIDSTQDLARRMAEEGSPEWSLVIADRQTRGRGRMAREWNSNAGGLYFSLILRPKIRPSFLARLSLDTADSVAQALTVITGLRTTVKPPNDVLAAPRPSPLAPRWFKVCGILAEASGNSRRTDWVVIGIGINVNNRIPSRLTRASSLSQLAGRDLDLQSVGRRVLGEFQKTYFRFLKRSKSSPTLAVLV